MREPMIAERRREPITPATNRIDPTVCHSKSGLSLKSGPTGFKLGNGSIRSISNMACWL